MANALQKDIVSCQECGIRRYQEPILDKDPETDDILMFVDLAPPKVRDPHSDLARPLTPFTPSGKILAMAEEELRQYGYSFYRTNLVKCPPLQGDKPRYPNSYEIEMCLDNLLMEIDYYVPIAVFLLGQNVYMPVLNLLDEPFRNWGGYYFNIYNIDGINYIPAWHPLYIDTYQKKNIPLYIEGIVNAVQRCDPEMFA